MSKVREMIDITTGHLIPLKEICRMFPGRNSKPIARSTVIRWMLKGTKNGHRLESVVVGGRRYTTKEAVERFVAACSGTAEGQHPKRKGQAGRDTRIVERHLSAEGF